MVGVRGVESDGDLETTEHGDIEELRVIGGSDDQAVRRILLEELQERVQHASDLSDVVARETIASDGIHLIEEVDAPCLEDRIEDKA